MRRGRRGRGGAILWALLLALGCVLLLRFVFVVRSVDVVGGGDVMSDEAVVRAAKIDFGSSIFRIDVQKIERGINATGLLKFERVDVRYPDTAVIYVKQRTREAMLLSTGKIRVLDGEGCVMESLDQVPDMDLVYVSGFRVMSCNTGERLQAESGQTEAYCAVIAALNSHAADLYVSELDVADPKNLRIVTRTGIVVLLGDMQRMEDKIAWMKSAVADLERRGEGGGTLDVSSGNKADYIAAAEQED